MEAANALELRVYREGISRAEASASWKAMAREMGDGVWMVRPLSEQIMERARLSSSHETTSVGTSTADLLHVAAALELGCGALYSFDRQQRALARHVRLKLN